jgi:hypothetical protein
MEYYKCPFAGALMANQFDCQCATEITRRDGPSIGCTSKDMQKKCETLFATIKQSALEHMGYEDDLTQMPHSALMKIQMGGLLGLQRVLGAEAPSVEDVQALVNQAEQQYHRLEQVPAGELAGDIAAFKLRRRR